MKNFILSEGLGRIRIYHTEGGRIKTANTGQITGVAYEFRITVTLSSSSDVFVIFGDGTSQKYTGTGNIIISKIFPNNILKVTDLYFTNPSLITEINLATAQTNVSGFNPIQNLGNSINKVEFLNVTVHNLFKTLTYLGSTMISETELINLPQSIETFFVGSEGNYPIKGNINSVLGAYTSLKTIRIGDISGNPYVVNSPLVFSVSQSTIDLNTFPILEVFHIRTGQPGLNTLILNSTLKTLIIGGSPIVNMGRLPNSVTTFQSGNSTNLDFDTKTIADYMPNVITNGFIINLSNVPTGKSIGAFNYPSVNFTSVALINVGVTSVNVTTAVLSANNNIGLTSITNNYSYVNACNISGNASLTTFIHNQIIGDGGFANFSNCPLLNTVIKVTTRPHTSITYSLNNSGMDKTTLIAQIDYIYANKQVKNASVGKNTFNLTGASNAALVQPTDGVYPTDDTHANTLFGFVRGGGTGSNGTAGSGDGSTTPVDGTPSNPFEKMYVLVNQCQTSGFHKYGANFLYNT